MEGGSERAATHHYVAAVSREKWSIAATTRPRDHLLKCIHSLAVGDSRTDDILAQHGGLWAMTSN